MTPLMILCFTFFACLIGAVPLDRRDVYNPPITSPKAGTEWQVGEKQTVTWNTTGMPPDSQVTNPIGRVVLGFLSTDGGFNLMLNTPLAQGFKVRTGQVEITVPDVPVRTNYIVVVFGDSGNASPEFTILGGRALSSSAAASQTSSSTILTAPIPITGTVITGGSTQTPVVTPNPSASPGSATATTPVSSASVPSQTSPASSSSAPSGSAAPAQVSSNSALRIGAFNGLLLSPALLTLFLAI